jgi:hypothetical protein
VGATVSHTVSQYLQFTINYLQFNIHYLQFTIHNSLFTIHNSLFTIHYSLFTILNPQFPIHNSQFTIHYLQFTIHNSLFTIQNSIFTIYNSQFTIHYSLFTIYHSIFTGDFNYCQLCRLETFDGAGQRFEDRRRRAIESAIGAAATRGFPGPSISSAVAVSLADLGGEWDGIGGESFDRPQPSSSAGAFSGGVIGNPNRPTTQVTPPSERLEEMYLGSTDSDEEKKKKDTEKENN